MRALALAVALLASAAALAGCEAGYIARAAYEEGRLLWRRKPIDTVLARGDLPPEVRARLETVLKVREFARDRLGLNVGNAYTSISEVDQGAIAWVVMAAPRDSLEPYTWWFPIVGRIPYRGYFNKDRAEAEAAEMEQRGYDTMVRPAVAFSSLGFFNDPLLSNLLRLNHVELAGVIIHELFHRTYFLASDVMFDESAATYVGSAGAVKFFEESEGPNSDDSEAARGILEADLKFADFLKRETERLQKLYQSGLPREEILRRRVAIFAAINADYARLKPQLSGLERFDLDKQPLNNAILINYLIYFHDLDNFAKLDRIYGGNLHDTIKAIIALAESDRVDPFYAIWQATRAAAQPAAAQAGEPQSAPGAALSTAPAATSTGP
ncbi:MAG TPA: aminopeptidase [Candidatus Binataceae bacterium]|jgi:predicted aminopeptidase|nr:aminopeptidase [Candidatus Binataceae bacterium]